MASTNGRAHMGMGSSSQEAAGRAALPATSEGFAAVDALVALTMLASTIVLALGAGDSARRTAAAALEAQKARLILTGLMNTPLTPGERSGFDGPLEWRLELAAPPTTSQDVRAVRLCRRAAVVMNRNTGRRYVARSVEVCTEQGAA